MTQQRIIVGLSGGVDSAVAAALLQRQGHQVEGLFMRNWTEDDAYCTAAEDFQSAQAVADVLGIPLHQADFSQAYKERVFADFVAEYEAGRTPSPDLFCNREIKFGEFARHARALGADAIATGHYARLEHSVEKSRLLQARDANKDQTYFLAATRGADLAGVHFPLGDLHKPEVRAIATELGLPNHQRKDSTGVCFIGERPMREFLGQWIATQEGDIRTDDGRTIGRHQGVAFYTLGQRNGLGIGGVKGAAEAPWYVAQRRTEDNVLLVTQDVQDPRLNARSLVLEPCFWLHEEPPAGQYSVRIRHRQPLQKANLQPGPALSLEFETPVWAAAEGQYAVIYRDDECLGCGMILAAKPS